LGKKSGGEDTMMDTFTRLLHGENEMDVWDEKLYANEEQEIRNLFLNDPEFMELIARVRTIKAMW
jgi:hypothetical protein